MRKIRNSFIILALIVLPLNLYAQDSPRIAALKKQIEKGGKAALQKFWDEVKQRDTPLLETIPGDKQKVLVTFLWQGAPDIKNVVVFSQVGNFNPTDDQMKLLPGTDVWYLSYKLGKGLRFLYSLSPNDDLTPVTGPNVDFMKRFAHLQPDPLNPHRFPQTAKEGQPNVQSIASLPGAAPLLWIARKTGTPAGTVAEQRVKSRVLQNERTVHVYLPPGYDKAKTYPLVVLFDGQSYLDLVPTPAIMDNLIAARKIPPAIVLLIDNPTPADRDKEFSCNKNYAEFLAAELLPWAKENYRITPDPAQTVIAGSSLGGLAAACAAMEYPAIFGKVLSQSASFWWKPDGDTVYEWVSRQFAAQPKMPLRFYITVGTLETLPKPGKTDQLEVNRRLRDALKAKDYALKYTEFGGAHEYIDWQATLPEGLIELLGKP